MCIFRIFRASNLCEHRSEAVFDLKLLVGWDEHKVVLDKHGSRVYYVKMDWGSNFLFVGWCPQSMGRDKHVVRQ